MPVDIEIQEQQTLDMSVEVETDPVFSASPAATITTSDIAKWNSADQYDGTFVVDYNAWQEDETTKEVTAGASYTGKTYQQLAAMYNAGQIPKLKMKSQGYEINSEIVGFTRVGDVPSFVPMPFDLALISALVLKMVPELRSDGKIYNFEP